MAVQVRKTVTVLFADVVGSTSLTETTDPERVRAALGPYFAAMREVVEQHGGSVEKFIGDAVMAVFGIPEVHEDDALRAVHAAVRMRERVADLDLPVPLSVRIGVTTGEVVAGEGETFATGDAVNVAARLETAAAPDEILVGLATYRLVQNAVRAEPVEPLELKGKADTVPAYRLLEVLPHTPAFTRRLDAPFVGREYELGALLGELSRVEAERVCRLAVVTGEAGIGKSRLVRELVQSVERTRVLVGRCLPYGEGITYWPLREIVQQVGGAVCPGSELERLVGAQATEAIVGAIGLGPVAAQGADIHWAVRQLFAAITPVVVVLDDLHWAEPSFLDLVDYLHAFARDAAIFLVATGRPELLDSRPGWRTAALELAPLGASEVARLVETLAASAPEAARRRVVEMAEGNPLFVEQLLATADEGDGDVGTPPTLRALLSSRIDALTARERAVAQCGAVEGRLFHRGAVQELVPDDVEPEVVTHLLGLVRRRLVRPDDSLFPGDDGFRFAHALIRDAAYAAMPKADRSAAHERYARWLHRVAPERDDVDEIVAYHLEQAALLSAEIGSPRHEIASAAGSLLAAAGRRAIRRGDVGAATGLLTRAISLLTPSPERYRVLAERAYVAIPTGDFAVATRAIDEALTAPEADDDARAQARLIATWITLLRADVPVEEARAALDADIAVLRAAGDDWWTARGLIIYASTFASEARTGSALPGLLSAFELEQAMADPATRAELLFWVGAAIVLGPVEVAPGRAQIEALAVHVRTPLEKAWQEFPLGMLAAYEGRFEDARTLFERSRGSMREIGAELYYAANSMFVAWMELMAGRLDEALAVAQEGWDLLGAAGEQGLRSSVGLHRACILAALGRDAEAEAGANEAIALTSEVDRTAQFHYCGVISRIRSHAGAHEDALRLGRESVAIATETDSSWHHAEAQLFLAEAAAAAGRDEERRAAARELLRLIDAHGLGVYRERALHLS